MKTDLIKAEIEKQRKKSVYILATFCILCLVMSWYQAENHGFILIVIFTGLFLVLACAFQAIQKLLSLLATENSNE